MSIAPAALPAQEAVEPLLARVLAAPSCQTDRFEQDPAVQAFIRDVVAAAAVELGLAAVVDDFGNLVVTVGPADGPAFALFTYAMTHPVNRMRDPFDPRPIDGPDGDRRLRGRGAAEQKGALAATLLAARALKDREDELAGPLVVCVSPSGETGRHDAARVFLEGLAAPEVRACIVAIGTDSEICVANK